MDTPDARLVELLEKSNKILIFTGAGISTNSGIPDFRGPQGIWKKRQPVYYQDFMRSEEARIEYWQYKLEGWETFRDAKPNAVHNAIVDLEKMEKILCVVTQNVDGLHSLAGTSPARLIELHGTNSEVECQSCYKRSNPTPHIETFRATHKPPLCKCGGFLKAATISFGQSLRLEDIENSMKKAQQADLAIALGSTLGVYPAAQVPLITAKRGKPYIVINRGPTDQDDSQWITLRLEGDVTEIFPPAVMGIGR